MREDISIMAPKGFESISVDVKNNNFKVLVKARSPNHFIFKKGYKDEYIKFQDIEVTFFSQIN